MFFRHNIPAFCWAILILFLSAMPSSNLPGSSVQGTDKVVHFSIYLLLSHLFIVGFKKQTRFLKLKHHAIPIAIIGSSLYGVFIEILQGTVFVTRHIELLDVLANSIGAIASVLSFKLVYGKLKI